MRRRHALFDQATLALLGSGPNLPPAIPRNAFLNEMGVFTQPCHLFFDDWHVIGDAEVESTVERLLLAPLPNVHLWRATRSPGRLPLARLRALGDLDELGSAELAFSAAEAARLFDLAADVTLAHRNVGDFLADEVFRRQEPELQTFLLQTSILRQFSTALCTAVTGRPDARRFLDLIEARNLFLFSLDSERGWYRYHHLFSDFLRKRLHEQDTIAAVECHRRACDWLSGNGFRVDAIEHAFAAADHERAGALLDAASAELSWQFDVARAALADARCALGSRTTSLAADDPESFFCATIWVPRLISASNG
ncbi:MAG: hypothetical protein HYX63_23755 [Gammaproteobacteria bacterium]|nr:hypothetical protein [Gammaproteobacteria bacterium]